MNAYSSSPHSRKTNSSTTPQKGDQPINDESTFQVGDQVKLSLDKETGPDKHLHGKTGEVKDEFDHRIKMEDGRIAKKKLEA